jgi:ribonuclease P protein component
LSEETNNYAKENISTKQPSPRQETRFSRTDGDQERTRRNQTPPRQRTQTINGSPLLDFRLPKENRLRKPSEFRRVYEGGKRFEGRFVTVFILPSATAFQRVGITASKKISNKAHDRNRAKRLLRETFRLSRAELDELNIKFDWVLNARRSLLRVKLKKPLEEFLQIVLKVKNSGLNKGEENVEARAK